MKIKTSELTGAALDWAVAQCENVEPDENNKPIWFGEWDKRVEYTPSTDWLQGGPIIEQEKIELIFDSAENGVWAAVLFPYDTERECFEIGPTPLIAAMRCRIASKLGDIVDVPEELA